MLGPELPRPGVLLYFYSKHFDSFHAEDSRASDQMASLPTAGATGCCGSQGGRQWRCESLPGLPLLSIPAARVLIRRPALRARRWLCLTSSYGL